MCTIDVLSGRRSQTLHTVVAGRKDNGAKNVDHQVQSRSPVLRKRASPSVERCVGEALVIELGVRQSKRGDGEDNIDERDECGCTSTYMDASDPFLGMLLSSFSGIRHIDRISAGSRQFCVESVGNLPSRGVDASNSMPSSNEYQALGELVCLNGQCHGRCSARRGSSLMPKCDIVSWFCTVFSSSSTRNTSEEDSYAILGPQPEGH